MERKPAITTEPPKQPAPAKPAPLTEEAAMARRVKLGFLGAIEKCCHVLYNAIPYALAMLIAYLLNEFNSFLNQGTLEKLPDLRYYGNMAEYGSYIIAAFGFVLHIALETLTQAKVDYDIFKKGGK